MNNQAKIEIELFVMLIVVVATSAAILLLIQGGIISVRADTNSEPILNAEFIPMGREGSLVFRDFYFCSYVSEDYQCIGESNEFELGNEVHFLFVVESSTFNGDLKLVENYRIRNPFGKVILDVGQKNTLHFDTSSSEKIEAVTFKDFFTLGSELPLGEYTLELVLVNPLLDKKVVKSEKFMVVEKTIEEEFKVEEEVAE